MSTAVSHLPEWLPDNRAPKCPTCSKSFGITLRRHHCRACGGVFCDSCSGARVKGHRVCNPCLKAASTATLNGNHKEPQTPERASKFMSPPATPQSSIPSPADALAAAAGPAHECKEAQLAEQLAELTMKWQMEKQSAEDSLNKNVAMREETEKAEVEVKRLQLEVDAGRESETELKQQLDELTARIAALEAARITAQQAGDATKATLEHERAETKEAKTKSDADAAEIQKNLFDALTELAATKKQLKELQSSYNDLSNANGSADSALTHARTRVKQLETEALGAAEAARTLSSSAEDLKTQIARLKTELADEQKKSSSATKDAADTKAKLATAIDTHAVSIRTLKEGEDALRRDIANLQRELDSKSRGASAETTELRDQLAKLKAELELKITILNNVTTQFNETKKSLDQSESSHDETKSELAKQQKLAKKAADEAAAEVKQFQKELKRTTDESATTIASLQAKLAALQAKYDGATEKSGDLDGRLAGLTASLASLTAAKLVADAALSDEKKQNSDLKKSLASATSDLDDSKNELKKQSKAAKKAADEAAAELKQAQAAHKQASDEANTASHSLQQSQKELKRVTDESAATIAALQAKLAAAQQQLEANNKKSSEADAKLVSLTASLAAQSASSAAAEAIVAAQKKTLSDLTKQLSDSAARLAEVERKAASDVAALRTDLESAQGRAKTLTAEVETARRAQDEATTAMRAAATANAAASTGELSVARQELAKAGERAMQLQGELAAAQQRSFDLQKTSDSEKAAMQRDVQALMDAAASSSAEEEKLQTQLDDVKVELANSTAKFVAKERQLVDQQTEIESLKKKLVDLSHQMEAELKQAHQDWEDTQKKLDATRAKLDEQAKKHAEDNERRDTDAEHADQQIIEAKRTSNQREAEYAGAQDRITELSARVKTLTQEAAATLVATQTAQAEEAALLEAARSDVNRLKAELAAAIEAPAPSDSARIAELQDALASAIARCDREKERADKLATDHKCAICGGVEGKDASDAKAVAALRAEMAAAAADAERTARAAAAEAKEMRETISRLQTQLAGLDGSGEQRNKLITEAKGTYEKLRPRIGVEVVAASASASDTGVRVTSVAPSSPAQAAALQVGDVITQIDRHPTESVQNSKAKLALSRPGDIIKLMIKRADEVMIVDVEVGAHGLTREQVQAMRRVADGNTTKADLRKRPW